MKNLFFVSFLMLASQMSTAQNIEECRKIVDLTVEAINKGSSENLNIYLSDEFSIAGQTGAIANMVLQQLFSQLGETVIGLQEIEQNTIDKGLELVYNIEYKKMGLKEAKFVFDEKSLLQELSLFKMEVKTMSKDDTKIEKSSQDVIEIPFVMAGNLIAVRVLLNGEYRTFILDTGSPKVILNSKYIATKDSSSKTISSSKGVSGSISGMDIRKVKQLDFSGIQMNNQDVLTLDLSHLEESLETDIYGLIGYELIRDYDIIFDYQNLKLTLINPEVFESYKIENLSGNYLQTIPLYIEGHIPVVKVKVGPNNYSYGIDSGAESNLISGSLFESLKKYTKRVKIDQLIGADNLPKEVKKGNIKKTTIGTKRFKNLETVFSDISHLNEGYKMNIDGLIGFPVLHKQKTLISYKRSELIFLE